MPNLLKEPLPVPPPHVSLRDYVDSRFDAMEKSANSHYIALDREADSRALTMEKAIAAALAAQEKAVSAALFAADRAVSKSEMASEKRFESVNEFRAALNDNSRLLMPRTETERALGSLTEKIDVLTTRVNQRDDRQRGMGALTGWIVSGVLLLIALAGLAIRIGI